MQTTDTDLRMKSANLFHSASPASADARFLNFKSDHMTTKSAWVEDCRAHLDWRNEQGVTNEET